MGRRRRYRAGALRPICRRANKRICRVQAIAICGSIKAARAKWQADRWYFHMLQ